MQTVMKWLSAVILTCFISFAPAAYAGQQPVLHVYTWSDYFEMDVVYAFERKFNCRVALKYLGYSLNTTETAELEQAGEMLSKSEVIRDLGAENSKYIAIWNRLKSQ